MRRSDEEYDDEAADQAAATAPAYIQDEDGHRHFFELCPQNFQPHAYSDEMSFL